MKYLIFDSGPIISLAMTGMLGVLEKLKKNFDGEFIVTPQVKREIIDKPMSIKKYKLEAVRVKNLLDKGILKMSSDIVTDNRLGVEVRKLMKVTGGILHATKRGNKIKVIHEGEASCLAFANLCKCDSVIVIDERSTRLLVEAPKNLKELMEKKLHTKLNIDLNLANSLKGYKIIRSSEVVFIAFKKGLVGLDKSKDVLDALLYGLKFKGTSISSGEIEEMKRL